VWQEGKPQPAQFAPGRISSISSIRGSVLTKKIRDAMARTTADTRPIPPRMTKDIIMILIFIAVLISD
jgi:hypothetical protein